MNVYNLLRVEGLVDLLCLKFEAMPGVMRLVDPGGDYIFLSDDLGSKFIINGSPHYSISMMADEDGDPLGLQARRFLKLDEMTVRSTFLGRLLRLLHNQET